MFFRSLVLSACAFMALPALAIAVRPMTPVTCPSGAVKYDVAATAFAPKLFVNPENSNQLIFTMFVAYKKCDEQAGRFYRTPINPHYDTFFGNLPGGRWKPDFDGQYSEAMNIDLSKLSLVELGDLLISLYEAHGIMDKRDFVRSLNRVQITYLLNKAVDSEPLEGYVHNSIISANMGTMVIELNKIRRHGKNRVRVLLSKKIGFYLDFELRDGQVIAYRISQ